MQRIHKLDESEMYDIYTRLFPEAFPKDEIRSWRSIRRQLQAGRYEGWGLYEDGELYSYAFFFHSGNGQVTFIQIELNIFFLEARQIHYHFIFVICSLQRQLAPAMLMGEVEVPDGGSHDELRLRRMHFYVRHGFVLEPVRSRVYGVTYRVISYARPASMTADDVCAALRAIYEELLASRLRMRLHVRIWQQEPEF